MKKIKLSLMDLLSVLEQLANDGTEEILIYETTDGYPAIVDANFPDDIISFGPQTDADGGDEPLPSEEGNEDLH